jgi:glycosyltransferase involved in cell wall biosynthesis
MTSPIRVLNLIARLNVGGPAKHVGWLMSGLDPSLFDQSLITGPVPANEDDMGPWLESQGVGFDILPCLGREINLAGDLAALKAILAELKKFRPHIIATHTAKAGFLGRLALMLYRPKAKAMGWPVPKCVHTFHGHVFHDYFSPAKTRLFLFLERWLAKRATWRIVAISPRMFEEIHAQYGVGKADQFVVLPLGIDQTPFLNPEPGRRRFREELGIGREDFLIGAVGRVAPVKNFGLFLETAAEFRKSQPELFARCRFVLIGGGSENDMAELTRQAGLLGVTDKVSFLGNRSDPEDFFPGLDALMLTSLNEGTPMSILEAGACARPVVATAVGGVPDLLGPIEEQLAGFVLHRRGLSAPSRDPAGLAAALAWLMKEPARQKALGGSLKAYVAAEHSRERLVADITALYEAAINQE